MKSLTHTALVFASTGAIIGGVGGCIGFLVWGILDMSLLIMMLGWGCLAPVMVALAGAAVGVVAGFAVGIIIELSRSWRRGR